MPAGPSGCKVAKFESQALRFVASHGQLAYIQKLISQAGKEDPAV